MVVHIQSQGKNKVRKRGASEAKKYDFTIQMRMPLQLPIPCVSILSYLLLRFRIGFDDIKEYLIQIHQFGLPPIFNCLNCNLH